LYEHADPRKGYHPDWKAPFLIMAVMRSGIFNSSAAFWMDKFHADGLRVDAVASMLIWIIPVRMHGYQCEGGRKIWKPYILSAN